MRATFILAAAALGPAFFALGERTAHADAFYVETGGGIAQFRSGDTFFGGAAPTGSYNLAMNIGIFRSFAFSDGSSEFHVGLQTRYDSGSNSLSGDYYASLTPYLVARYQFAMFYLEAGASPYVLRRISTSSGFNDLQHATGYAYLAESGLLWSVTPKFSMGLAATAQWVDSGGTLSPSPIIEGTAYMRFYFGFSSGHSGSSQPQYSGEWKGWRYPFGHEMK